MRSRGAENSEELSGASERSASSDRKNRCTLARRQDERAASFSPFLCFSPRTKGTGTAPGKQKAGCTPVSTGQEMHPASWFTLALWNSVYRFIRLRTEVPDRLRPVPGIAGHTCLCTGRDSPEHPDRPLRSAASVHRTRAVSHCMLPCRERRVPVHRNPSPVLHSRSHQKHVRCGHRCQCTVQGYPRCQTRLHGLPGSSPARPGQSDGTISAEYRFPFHAGLPCTGDRPVIVAESSR